MGARYIRHSCLCPERSGRAAGIAGRVTGPHPLTHHKLVFAGLARDLRPPTERSGLVALVVARALVLGWRVRGREAGAGWTKPATCEHPARAASVTGPLH
jgi:hypothetical protein